MASLRILGSNESLQTYGCVMSTKQGLLGLRNSHCILTFNNLQI